MSRPEIVTRKTRVQIFQWTTNPTDHSFFKSPFCHVNHIYLHFLVLLSPSYPTLHRPPEFITTLTSRVSECQLKTHPARSLYHWIISVWARMNDGCPPSPSLSARTQSLVSTNPFC